MSFIQSMCSSFKEQVLLGEHDLLTDTIKIALYESTANIGPNTTEYSTFGEVVGEGYTAGGNTLTGATLSLSGGVAFANFANSAWSPASFTARGALIYNASKGNKAVAVLDFGADKTASTNFVVQMPSNSASSALVRFS